MVFPISNDVINKINIHENNENSAEYLNDPPGRPIEPNSQAQVEATLLEKNNQQVSEKLIETLKFNLYFLGISLTLLKGQWITLTNTLLRFFLC